MAAEDETGEIELSLSSKEISMIMRGISWLHQDWNEEAFIVTDFRRDEYRQLLNSLRRKLGGETRA